MDGGRDLAKKKIHDMSEVDDKLEKIGGPLALGVVITLVIIIVIALVIKFCFGGAGQAIDESSTENTLDLNIFDGIDTSSQLEEYSTQVFPAVSGNEAGTGSQGESDPDGQETVQPSDLPSGTAISLYNKNFLETEDYPQVTELIQAYFTAYESCSMKDLMSLVDYNGGTPITQDELEQRAQIVEKYQGLVCYLIEGMDSNSFVVYASYNVKFYNISAPAPTLTRFYVVIADDGTAHIYNGEITAKLNAYLKEVNEYDCIKELSDRIDQELDEACSQDARLEELMEILYGRESAREAEEQE